MGLTLLQEVFVVGTFVGIIVDSAWSYDSEKDWLSAGTDIDPKDCVIGSDGKPVCHVTVCQNIPRDGGVQEQLCGVVTRYPQGSVSSALCHK